MPANSRPMILDGAMGTQLMRSGLNLPLPLWSADINITHPDIVRNVHKDYVSAGADIITTNTFRSTTWSYRKAGYTLQAATDRAKESLMRAVDSAQKSKAGMIAGSITSIEDCYSPKLFPGRTAAEDSYGEMLLWFEEAGIDLILFETMSHIDEIEIAISLSKNFKKVWLSLIIKDSDHLLSGHLIEEAFDLSRQRVDCVMLNCNTLSKSNQCFNKFKKLWGGEWGIFPNLGQTEPEIDGKIDIMNSDEVFTNSILNYLNEGPSVIGSCCGSSPKHTKIIKEMIDKN